MTPPPKKPLSTRIEMARAYAKANGCEPLFDQIEAKVEAEGIPTREVGYREAVIVEILRGEVEPASRTTP